MVGYSLRVYSASASDLMEGARLGRIGCVIICDQLGCLPELRGQDPRGLLVGIGIPGDHDLWGLCGNGRGRYTESVQQWIVLSSRNFFAVRFLLLQNFGTQVGSPCTRMQTKHVPVGPAGRVVVSVDSSGEAELGSVFNL